MNTQDMTVSGTMADLWLRGRSTDADDIEDVARFTISPWTDKFRKPYEPKSRPQPAIQLGLHLFAW